MKKYASLFVLPLVFSFFLSACGTLKNQSSIKSPVNTDSASLTESAHATFEKAAPQALTEIEAKQRSAQISNVLYSLWFGLDKTHEDFAGKVSIQFELNAKAKAEVGEVFLDFSQGSLQSIVVNGTTLEDLGNPIEIRAEKNPSKDFNRYDGNHIHFKMSELYAGTNRIQIAFRHAYDHNGHGLHRFVDPADHAVYLYSDLEPYYAHEIFPDFDQPDLKAKFDVTVVAPKTWQVVTNTLEKTPPTETENETKTWVFPQSLPLSTYIFALIAGDYTHWSADASGIPMRLFARKSLKKYIDADEWFDISR